MKQWFETLSTDNFNNTMNNKDTKLNEEIERCEELLKMYLEIPTGFFGATMIRMSIDRAKKAKTKVEIKEAIKELEDITG
jgi:hypothetical protein